jgi:hypothetical protein
MKFPSAFKWHFKLHSHLDVNIIWGNGLSIKDSQCCANGNDKTLRSNILDIPKYILNKLVNSNDEKF